MTSVKSNYEKFIFEMSKYNINSGEVKTEEMVTFEKGIFKTKKRVKKIIVKKGNYYSLRGLCYYLDKFQNTIYNEQIFLVKC